MAEFLLFDGLTSLPESPESVLDKAKEWGMEKCIIVGYSPEGRMIFGGSFCEPGEIVLLLELAKKFVIDNEIMRIPST